MKITSSLLIAVSASLLLVNCNQRTDFPVSQSYFDDKMRLILGATKMVKTNTTTSCNLK
jgi:hypothetical protein